MEAPREMVDEEKLILSARDDYNSGKYGACKATLNTLAAARPNDWKVSLNRIMIDFLGSEDKNLQALQDQISALCSRMNISLVEVDHVEDVEHCVLHYNQAIVFFKMGQYREALNVVSKIFPLVHKMEGNLARKVCVLLLDLDIYLKDYNNALVNLVAIEKQYNMVNTIPALSGSKPSDSGSSGSDTLHMQRFKSVLLEYKARIQLALGEYDACQETLDTLITSGCLSYTTSILRAKLCVILDRYEEAIDVLHVFMQGIDEFDVLPPESKMVFYNNLAIVNHLLNRSHSSSFFTNKSLRCFHEGLQRCRKNPRLTARYFNMPTLLKLMYNRGVSLLFRGEPAKAFDCLLEVAQKMFRSPILWLRLAECCIRINKPGNGETFNLSEKRKELVKGLCKNKNNSNIILNNKIYQDSNYNSETQSYAVPTPTMEFASICGRNALLLLPEGSSKLKLGVLAANAYVRLSIGDPVLALKYANSLLQEDGVSPLYKYLGRLYASEAYLDLNQLDNAIQILDPNTHKECDPTAENPGPDFLPNSQSAGQSVLLYNLAVALVIRKELEKASELLKHVWISRGTDGQVPVHVLALALYIELVQGRVDVAKTIIKQNCPQVFS